VFLTKLMPKQNRHSLPIRTFHWTLTGSYFLLLYSGLHIAHPQRFPYTSMRRAHHHHTAGQCIFLGAILWRVYHGIKTGNYRDIVFDKKALQKVPKFFRYEFFLSSREPKFPKYNPFQKLLYTFWTPVFLMLGLTGVILHLPLRLSRLEAAFGGLHRIRRLHYVLSLVSISTVMGHIYLALTSGKEALKSMFTGYKTMGKK
jgi:thiosulfate reductase cytochrome b subunit